MADNLLNTTLAEVSTALQPLSRIDSAQRATEFFAKLGYGLPGSQNFNALPAGLVTKIVEVGESVIDLVSATNDDDRIRIAFELSEKVAQAAVQIAELENSLRTGGGIPANFFNDSHIDELPRRLLDYLIANYLEIYHSGMYGFLLLLGVADEISQPADEAAFQPAFTLRKIWWERLPRYFTEPRSLVEEIYQWETDFNSDLFLERVERVIRGFVLPGGLYRQNPSVRGGLGNTDAETRELRIPIFQAGNSPELYCQFGLLLSAAAASGPKRKGLALMPYFMGVSEMAFNLNERLEIVLESSASIDNGIGVVLRPPLDLELVDSLFTAPATVGSARLKLTARVKTALQGETLLFGSADGTRFSIKGLQFAAFAAKEGATIDYGFEFGIREAKVVISSQNADGFLKTVLSAIETEVDFEFLIGFSAANGVYFQGSGSLEVRIPVHIELGPIKISGLLLKLQPESRQFPLTVGANLGFDLGPLQAVAQDIGLKFILSFPDGGGNLGPAQFGLDFKPPNGVGLSIDTGVIKGGGFLGLDFEKGEYIGALELSIQGTFSLKAVAIINTKLPDGSPGFSLLVIITADFTPIQLGYGFTLNAVGGLLGLNRTTRIEVLREGVKTNALKSVLFPENVVANINRIISDLKQIFPQQPDRFLIAPMAKLGWGTPSIITLELGILLEIPVPRIAILGVIKAILPNEAAAVLRIQVNFLGVIDFENKYISFDASLYDSRLLIFTLTGDMAFRLSWGDNPLFILSVGGFHPAFRDAPADLQRMTRLTISLLSGENPRIKIECYFAVTANTVQFGARAELYAEAAGFNVYGYLGFDVLFQFSPFRFVASLYAGLALRRSTSVIMGIRLSGELSGPTPWDVRGEASFSILFFDVTVSFHETWGDRPDAIDTERVNILPLLEAEIADNRNWKADIPNHNSLHVAIRQIEQTNDKLAVHPFGILTFSERLVPLEINITKFGNKVPGDGTRFEIRASDPSTVTEPVTESFAPANFFSLKDNEKLSRPSFEPLQSGFKITGTNVVQTPTAVSKSVDYELSYLRKKRVALIFVGIYKFAKDLFLSSLKSGAVAKSTLSFATNRISANAPDNVIVNADQFAIANVNDLRLHAGGQIAGSYTQAAQMYDELLAQNPALQGQIQVVSAYELNRN